MDELVRVARDPTGSLVVGRHLPGRGAWLCRGSAACVDRAIAKRAFDRAFRARLEDRQVDRDRLVTWLSAGAGEDGARRLGPADVRG
jgi:predicted RNA-binding protein YlxR (DUF448 family)